MTDAEPTLLLTRPEPQSGAFLSMCETRLGRRVPVVISPVMRIEQVGEVPRLERFGTIVVTSGNGIERLGRALAGQKVRTVGRRTADLAREFGADAVALGENADAFIGNSGDLAGPLLVVRGVHARGDMAERLAAQGFEVEQAVLYDQVAVPLNRSAQTLLTGDSPVIVPVFSPRTARLLAQAVISAPLRIMAISQATASAWTGPGRVDVADTPDAEAMCKLVEQAF